MVDHTSVDSQREDRWWTDTQRCDPKLDMERSTVTDVGGIMRRFAYTTTRGIAMVHGDSFPYYYVSEHPKSGGTWLSRMLADSLMLPFPQKAVLPLGFSCVIQNHWPYSARLNRCVYLHRDGRDVMVSFFFHMTRNIKAGHSPWARNHARVFEKLYGRNSDLDDAPAMLPRFIEHMMRNPHGSKLNWPDHVESWLPARSRPMCAFVSYTELRKDPVGAMRRIVNEIGRDDVDDVRIREAVDRYSIQRMTGRAPGQEDRNHFIRKGAVGDWRNHFTRDAARIFDELAGEALVTLGYEPDRDWVRNTRFIGESESRDLPRVSPMPGCTVPDNVKRATERWHPSETSHASRAQADIASNR